MPYKMPSRNDRTTAEARPLDRGGIRTISIDMPATIMTMHYIVFVWDIYDARKSN